MVKTRTAVQDVHQLVQRLGGEVIHVPQSFPQYPPPYFAMFWLDPFGVMLEVVCHYDRDSPRRLGHHVDGIADVDVVEVPGGVVRAQVDAAMAEVRAALLVY